MQLWLLLPYRSSKDISFFVYVKPFICGAPLWHASQTIMYWCCQAEPFIIELSWRGVTIERSESFKVMFCNDAALRCVATFKYTWNKYICFQRVPVFIKRRVGLDVLTHKWCSQSKPSAIHLRKLELLHILALWNIKLEIKQLPCL